MSNILVVAEHRKGELRESTFETIGAARQVAAGTDLDIVTALLADDSHLAPGLQGRTPLCRVVTHAELKELDTEAVLPPLIDLVHSLAPRLILLGHTSFGMDLAPALAGRLGYQLVTDCTQVLFKGGALQVQRTPFGGKLVETLTLKEANTTVITLQGGAFAPAQSDLITDIRETALDRIERRHARCFRRFLDGATDEVDISAAPILVSVGRGIGNEDNIALAQRLADAVGGVVSCSRPVADAGWLPQTRQVGTSGQTVRPKLYIALGISGAFQHLAGMRGSETILAVNKDSRAPIFAVADYGIVGDLLEVLPTLTQQLR